MDAERGERAARHDLQTCVPLEILMRVPQLPDDSGVGFGALRAADFGVDLG